MNRPIQAYLRLTRPPNLLTAISDIWAGAALSGFLVSGEHVVIPLALLSLSSVFLYAGGVVMNDVFDAALDAVERPERPIPAGVVSRASAARWGGALLVVGVLVAALQSMTAGILAFLIALACLCYDSKTKPHVFWGPVNMGVCRGLNLLLGMCAVSSFPFAYGWVAITPVIYIAAITLISRGEVHGANHRSTTTAMACYVLVTAIIAWTAYRQAQLMIAAVFLLLFVGFVFPSLVRAMRKPSGPQIGRAVKAGVLGLILMNASWVAASAGWQWAAATALLLPASILVAKRYAVT